MTRVTKLKRKLTLIKGFSGLVEGITRVSVDANLSQGTKVLKIKRYTPISPCYISKQGYPIYGHSLYSSYLENIELKIRSIKKRT